MHTSVRSYLSAGTVAVVGAGAIALTPALPAAVNVPAVPAPAVAEVTLTGLSLSLDQIVGVLGKFGMGDVLSPVINLIPANLINAFTAELSSEALSLIATAAKGVLGDVGAVVTGLITGPSSILRAVTTAVGSVPKAVITAVQTMATGGGTVALQEVIAAVSAPLAGVTEAITEAAKVLRDSVGKRLADVVNAIPNLLVNVVQSVVVNDFKSLVDLVKNAVAGIVPIIGKLLPLASVRPAVVAAPAAAAVAPRASAVSASPVAEVPASVTIAPRAVELPKRAAAQARSALVKVSPAASTGDSAGPRAAATAADEPTAAPASRAQSAQHPRGPVTRPSRASR